MNAQQNIISMTVARSAQNILQSTGLSRQSVWAAMRARAVRAESNKLEFADGSILRFDPQASGFIAC